MQAGQPDSEEQRETISRARQSLREHLRRFFGKTYPSRNPVVDEYGGITDVRMERRGDTADIGLVTEDMNRHGKSGHVPHRAKPRQDPQE